MINLYLIKLKVNGIPTGCTIVGKEPFNVKTYEDRIKRSYYNGSKNIRTKDKFEIVGYEIIKPDLGLIIQNLSKLQINYTDIKSISTFEYAKAQKQ